MPKSIEKLLMKSHDKKMLKNKKRLSLKTNNQISLMNKEIISIKDKNEVKLLKVSLCLRSNEIVRKIGLRLPTRSKGGLTIVALA